MDVRIIGVRSNRTPHRTFAGLSGAASHPPSACPPSVSVGRQSSSGTYEERPHVVALDRLQSNRDGISASSAARVTTFRTERSVIRSDYREGDSALLSFHPWLRYRRSCRRVSFDRSMYAAPGFLFWISLERYNSAGSASRSR